MPKFLFWNIGKKSLEIPVSRICNLHGIDILVLCESTISETDILRSLNSDISDQYFYLPEIGCEKIKIFGRYEENMFSLVHESSRMQIRKLSLPGADDLLVAACHLPDKGTWDEESQHVECERFAQEIRSKELELGIERTVLVGDLNMNPFDLGMIKGPGFNATMCSKTAFGISRTIQEREYAFFYNPMWNLFGDQSGPAGTYYYRKSVHKIYFWNMFDQVLIRPTLIPNFVHNELEILSSDGVNSLLNASGFPDAKNYSDHLPIKFQISI